MGHAINYDDFSTKVSKDKIYAAVNERAVEESDYHHLPEKINWYDKCLNSRDEAMQFIENHDASYRNLAVKYKYQKDFKPSAALVKLKNRHIEASKLYNSLYTKPHFAEHKSEYIGCRHCGSKLASKYMTTKNYCPLCNQDMRPVSTLDRLAKMKQKVDELYIASNGKERAERLKLSTRLRNTGLLNQNIMYDIKRCRNVPLLLCLLC